MQDQRVKLLEVQDRSQDKAIIRVQELVASSRKDGGGYVYFLIGTFIVGVYNTNRGIVFFRLTLLYVGFKLIYLDMQTQNRYNKCFNKFEKNMSCCGRLMEKGINHSAEKGIKKEGGRLEALIERVVWRLEASVQQEMEKTSETLTGLEWF